MKLWRNVLVHLDGRQDAREALERSELVARAFGGRVIAVDSTFDGGAQGRRLLGLAERRGADLIFKATSAADVREMTVSGVTALHLLRASQVPVFLYAPPARRGGRVVAVVELEGCGSERQALNERVLLAAARLSLLESAELHLACVADRGRDRLYESILRPSQYRNYIARDRDDLRRSLSDMTARLAPLAVPHLVEGNPVDALARLVLELDADAVTLGRDGAGMRAGSGGVCPERLFCRIDRSMLLVTSEAASIFASADGAHGRRSTQAALGLSSGEVT